MYLVSLYFDDKASRKIQGFINKVALETGNNFMIDGQVPPHITIASFQTTDEDKVIELLSKVISEVKEGIITWASIGVFKSSVLFLSPILNEYLHNLSVKITENISEISDVSISKYYLPFQWMPHTTIAKKLSREELFVAFQTLEKYFNIFNGTVNRIVLSKTNPYEDIVVWNL